ncbi:transposase [Mesorhizobium sp. M0207]|uniref:transposase n=1 Tax=Mesorhizobium sp. M0207 TaxID=2956915 RepID=UPI0033370C10
MIKRLSSPATLPILRVWSGRHFHSQMSASAADLIKDLPESAMLLADKGYDANALRTAITDQNTWANIPQCLSQGPDLLQPFLYKARNLIERFFNKAKQFRRIATRYDKLAENFLAALKLVAIRIWPRSYESTS